MIKWFFKIVKVEILHGRTLRKIDKCAKHALRAETQDQKQLHSLEILHIMDNLTDKDAGVVLYGAYNILCIQNHGSLISKAAIQKLLNVVDGAWREDAPFLLKTFSLAMTHHKNDQKLLSSISKSRFELFSKSISHCKL